MCGVFVYGWYAGLVLLTCLIAAYLSDLLCRRFIYKKEAEFFGNRDGIGQYPQRRSWLAKRDSSGFQPFDHDGLGGAVRAIQLVRPG